MTFCRMPWTHLSNTIDHIEIQTRQVNHRTRATQHPYTRGSAPLTQHAFPPSPPQVTLHLMPKTNTLRHAKAWHCIIQTYIFIY